MDVSHTTFDQMMVYASKRSELWPKTTIAKVTQAIVSLAEHHLPKSEHFAPLFVIKQTVTPLTLPDNFEEGAKKALLEEMPSSNQAIANEKTLSDWVLALQEIRCRVHSLPTQQVIALLPEDQPLFCLAQSGPLRYSATFNWLSDGSSLGLFFSKLDHNFFSLIPKNHQNKIWRHQPPHEGLKGDPCHFTTSINFIIMQYLGPTTVNTLTVQFNETSQGLQVDSSTMQALQITVFPIGKKDVSSEEVFDKTISDMKKTTLLL